MVDKAAQERILHKPLHLLVFFEYRLDGTSIYLLDQERNSQDNMGSHLFERPHEDCRCRRFTEECDLGTSHKTQQVRYAEFICMAHRENRKDLVAFVDLDIYVRTLVGTYDEVLVCEYNALALSGCSACVDDRCRVILIRSACRKKITVDTLLPEGNPGRGRKIETFGDEGDVGEIVHTDGEKFPDTFDLPVVFRVDTYDAGAALFDYLIRLALRKIGKDRNGDGTDDDSPEVHDHPHRGALPHYCDPITFLYAVFQKERRHTLAVPFEMRVGDRLLPVLSIY